MSRKSGAWPLYFVYPCRMSLSYEVQFRGFRACPCLARWLPWYERELLRRGVIKKNIDIFQLIGDAPASAGTHSRGGAFDIAQTSDEAILVARQMGADATWHRSKAQGFTEHAHGVLRGCPHNGPVVYQIHAVDDGYNGLGKGGRDGKDDGPRPLSGRTWKQGIRWSKKQTPPTRVEMARDLIENASAAAKSAARKAKLEKALKLLPKR